MVLSERLGIRRNCTIDPGISASSAQNTANGWRFFLPTYKLL